MVNLKQVSRRGVESARNTKDRNTADFLNLLPDITKTSDEMVIKKVSSWSKTVYNLHILGQKPNADFDLILSNSSLLSKDPENRTPVYNFICNPLFSTPAS